MSITEVDHFYLSRREQRQLLDLLRDDIPTLAIELGVATTLQVRVDPGGPRGRGLASEMRAFDDDASRLADELHNELATTIRMVCEQRDLEFVPVGYTHQYGFVGPLRPGESRAPRLVATSMLARWLDRHIIALALTEGAPDAHVRILDVVQRAARCVAPPTFVPDIDERKIAGARTQTMTARGIVALARELGDEYRHLNIRRIQTLADRGLVQPAPGPWWADTESPELVRATARYIVGDVLDAHLLHPIRRRG